MALDRSQIVTSDEQDGVLRLRFSHPLLHTVAERQLSATRRRALSRRLRAAPADHVDIVRRATWEDAGGGAPNVELLLAAADAVLMNDPAAALRLALRAQQAENSVLAAKTVAAAHSELGRPDLARGVLDAASGLIASDDDRLTYAAEDLSLALWGERDPQRAWAIVDRLRTELPGSDNAVLGAEAVVRLFTGGCVEVIALARQILDNDPDPSARIRALTCLTGALAFADRGSRGDRRRTAVARRPVGDPRLGDPDRAGVRAGRGDRSLLRRGVPAAAAGRYLRPLARRARAAGGADRHSRRRRLRRRAGFGDRSRLALPRRTPAAFPRRPGRVRWRRCGRPMCSSSPGTGLFRSEATAELVIVLAELGQYEEAAAIMRDHPPDAIAIIPGLAAWAQSAVDAAAGHHSRATELAIDAARDGRRQGCGRDGDELPHRRRAATATRGRPPRCCPAWACRWTPTSSGSGPRTCWPGRDGTRRSCSMRPRRSSRPASTGTPGSWPSWPGRPTATAPSGGASPRSDGSRRIVWVPPPPGSAAALAPSPLTQRETEVARLAGRGLSDREIADDLVLSIRTVQSHLASAYRKLGITSRNELGQPPAVMAPTAEP